MSSLTQQRAEEQLVLAFLVKRNGSASLPEIKQAKLVPSWTVTSVMRRLISGKIVELQGDAVYKLVAKGKQAREPDSPSQLGGSEPATEPVSNRVQSPVTSAPCPPEPKPDRRCARCKAWKPADQFPQRDGLLRPARLCDACLAPLPISPVIDRVEPDPLSAARRSGQLVDLPSPADAVAPLLSIEITAGVHGYLLRLLATGLWGHSIQDVAERLICRGLIVQLSSGGMLAPIPEIST